MRLVENITDELAMRIENDLAVLRECRTHLVNKQAALEREMARIEARLKWLRAIGEASGVVRGE